ncbi:Uma2 family endonuclease [Argonema galeatum]|uniref:Uma2 family endonuclease n=1 Tax=Argonema galeatum TaxID=2942762 RepID=UPI00201381BA|nr:Uma2 family endonuclease [Argonema galeatum]MCL1463426.1 Uma2 family endonuclease [Argonema galeatum A003/A1]
MIVTQKKTYSFEEYLAYHDDTDLKYELFNGELIPMPPASGIHALIMVFLYDIFKAEIQRLGLNWLAIPNSVGVRTAERKSRIPDLVILSEIQRESIRTMSSAVLESSPILAVEIVSEGNPQDDYRYKRSEYAVRGIPEYWIVDPIKSKISILLLVEGFYERTEFTGNQTIVSPTFPELTLTVEQILAA